MSRILILGTNDRASAAAVRLFHAGFQIILTECLKPLNLYINRNFTKTVYNGNSILMGVTSRTLANAAEIGMIADTAGVDDFLKFELANREIPLLTETETAEITDSGIRYLVCVDPTLLKLVPEPILEDAKIIGFEGQEQDAPADYHIAVQEPYCGLVKYPFNSDSFPEIRMPAPRKFCKVHVPIEGVFVALKQINDQVSEKEPLAKINDIPVLAPEIGRLTGLLNSGIIIPAGVDFAEIAPTTSPMRGDIIPSSEWGIAGGILEAILYDINLES